MKKILIISDTHGREYALTEVLNKEGEPDFLIHAGDTSGHEDRIRDMVSCPFKTVLGNNDYSFLLKYEEVFEYEGYTFYLTHGHRQSVWSGTDRLIYRGIEADANVIIYGHTHIPEVGFDDEYGVWLVNPGSLTYPRQDNHRPSYIVMTIPDDGEPKFDINFL